MTGYWRCLSLSLRTGWPQVLGWPLMVAALVVASAATINGTYPDRASRDRYAGAYELLDGSAALQGRGYDLNTLGGILVNEMGYLTLIMIPLIGVHLAIRFTRSVEDTGRLDILTSYPVHRLAPAAAGVTAAAFTAALTALITATGLTALGFPLGGSGRYAGGLAMFMVVFIGIGTLVAQCCRTARTAYLLATGIWLISYLARAAVDAQQWDAAGWNPQSWLAEIRPFAADPPLWPWIASGALAVGLLAATAAVAARRDQGAGIIAPRPGPATAPGWVRSPLTLLLRLTAGIGVGWVGASALFAFAFGYLTPQINHLDAATQVDHDATVNATLAIFVQLNALLAAAAGIQIAQWLAAEETSGRVGYSLSTVVSRWRWWTSATLLVTVWSLLVLLCGGLSTGLGLVAGFGEGHYFGKGLTATLSYTAAVVLLIGGAVAVHSLSPRAVPVAWLPVGWGIVVCLRADLLELPSWARQLSPVHWIGAVPRDAWHRPAALTMTAVAILLVAVSTVRYRWRDLEAG
ncbi:ABC transporter permease [Micromonospora sp. CA-263727]|uniref:ABC transporter permease n=1 Tax=Micromonospora sp. CA-263727 TaxID=3239967 RepID=UPI003D916E82